MPPNGVLEIPECAGGRDDVQNIFANPLGLNRAREIRYRRPGHLLGPKAETPPGRGAEATLGCRSACASYFEMHACIRQRATPLLPRMLRNRFGLGRLASYQKRSFSAN